MGETNRIKNNYFDGLKVTKQMVGIYGLTMAAYFFEQMDNWNWGFVAPAVMKHWGVDPSFLGKVAGFYFLCMTLGGLCGGFLSDRFGRRKVYLASIVIFSFGSVMDGIVDDPHLFMIFRGITGFGIFCLMVCSQVYIAEMAPAESRGKWQGLITMVGFCAVPLIGIACRIIVPMSETAFKWIFLFGGVGIVIFLIGLAKLKESPRWLIAKGRQDEAEKVMRDLTGLNIDLSDAAAMRQPKISLIVQIQTMFSKKYIKVTILLLIVFICCMPGSFVLNAWTPTLLKLKGFTLEQSLMASTIMTLGVPLGGLLSALFSDKGGRKMTIFILGMLVGISGIAFGYTTHYALFVIIGLLLNAFVIGNNFTLYAYAAEQYPTTMRNTTQGIHNAVGRFSVTAFQMLIPLMFATWGFHGVFNFYILYYIFPSLLILFFGVSTAGRSLEDLNDK